MVIMPVQVTPGTAWRGLHSEIRIAPPGLRNRSACLFVTRGRQFALSLLFVFQPDDLAFKIGHLAAAYDFIDRITAGNPDEKGDRRRYDWAMGGFRGRHLLISSIPEPLKDGDWIGLAVSFPLAML
ncbi:hypothetical protein ACOJBO_03885 [Rhizobium beringeri]